MSEPKIIIRRAETDSEFDNIFTIRNQVFVKELHVPEDIEDDGNDFISHLYLAFLDGMPCGTARWRITPFGKIKLERFAVFKEQRGKGVGRALVECVLNEIPKSTGMKVYLHGQITALDFWEKLGFVKEGEPFEEAGIVHYIMVWPQSRA